jgi:hypothetical protein
MTVVMMVMLVTVMMAMAVTIVVMVMMAMGRQLFADQSDGNGVFRLIASAGTTHGGWV